MKGAIPALAGTLARRSVLFPKNRIKTVTRKNLNIFRDFFSTAINSLGKYKYF